jgi:hypothetical protein
LVDSLKSTRRKDPLKTTCQISISQTRKSKSKKVRFQAIEKVEGTIVKAIELSSRGKAGAEYPSKQPYGTTLTRTIAGRKEGLNQSIEKPEHMTSSLALQTDLLRYSYLTNSSLQTTPSTTTKPNLGSGSGSTLSQLN